MQIQQACVLTVIGRMASQRKESSFLLMALIMKANGEMTDFLESVPSDTLAVMYTRVNGESMFLLGTVKCSIETVECTMANGLVA